MHRNTLLLLLFALAIMGAVLLIAPGVAQTQLFKTYFVPGVASSNPNIFTTYYKTYKTTATSTATSSTASSTTSSTSTTSSSSNSGTPGTTSSSSSSSSSSTPTSPTSLPTPTNSTPPVFEPAWLWNGNYVYLNPNATAVGIKTSQPTATLEVNGTLKISGPDNRYFHFFFGALNDFAFNGSALIIHPAWSVYNPAALVYFSGNLSDFKVGIGTDHPEYKLDVAGNIRAISSAVLADYFQFTESGKPTAFRLDYFPNTIIGNAIGLAYYNGKAWTPVMAISSAGYIYTPRLYITEEGSNLHPYWYLDYVPDNGRLTFVYNNVEKMWLLPSGDLYITGNLHVGTNSRTGAIYGPDGTTSIVFASGSPWINITGKLKVVPPGTALTRPPSGWRMGVWTWYVYAEGTIAVGRNGNVIAALVKTQDGQGAIYLNNTINGAWARISRWTNRLEILSSDAIEFAIGSVGNDIIHIDNTGMYTKVPIYVEDTLKISGPNGRYFHFFFGTLNDFAFNGPALIIHPAWSVYTPSALIYISGDVNNFRVGIGTDHPEYKLDVAGDIRATGNLYVGRDVHTNGVIYGANGFPVPPIVITPDTANKILGIGIVQKYGGRSSEKDYIVVPVYNNTGNKPVYVVFTVEAYSYDLDSNVWHTLNGIGFYVTCNGKKVYEKRAYIGGVHVIFGPFVILLPPQCKLYAYASFDIENDWNLVSVSYYVVKATQ